MPTDAKSTSAAQARPAGQAGGGRVRLRTLVLTRWIAVTGQTITILVVYVGLGYDLPVVLSLLAVAASAALNIVVTLRYPSSKRLSDTQAAFYLAYDTLQIAILLALNGGLHNPFSLLILIAVTISATILSIRSTVWLGAFSLVCLSALGFVHMPLPWPGGGHYLSHLYVFGVWTALVVGMGFFSLYVMRVAEEGRRMSDALTETQMALARQQRLSAVGGLAAAAAHELGTPLGTIAMVAKELRRELPADSPYAEDLALLVEQSDRCRDILAQLTLRPESEDGSPFYRLRLMTLISSVAGLHWREGVTVNVEVGVAHLAQDDAEPEGTVGVGSDEPVVFHHLEVVHGLGNLIPNAVDCAHQPLPVTAAWGAPAGGTALGASSGWRVCRAACPPGRRRAGRGRSSTSWSRRRAASTRAPSAALALTALSI